MKATAYIRNRGPGIPGKKLPIKPIISSENYNNNKKTIP